ncbi:MAG: hypothetical protein ABIA93_05430 [Candidatus Woesearchaeota archaeon]
MPRISVSERLQKDIEKTFGRAEGNRVYDLFDTLLINPHKGKALGHSGKYVIKELKYKKFRFYFMTDGIVLKFGTADELAMLLIRFVRMSEKKDQKAAIEEVKNVLNALGFGSV